MEFSVIPVIIILCYIIGEIYKVIFKTKAKMNSLLPMIVSLFGGVLGIIIFYTDKEMIGSNSNIWLALQVGLVSGASSTGANQIIKQIFKLRKEENKDGQI